MTALPNAGSPQTHSISTIPEALALGVERWPDRPWCTAPDGAITRAQVYEDALRVSGTLRDLGVGVGDHVVVVLPNGIEFLRAWLGTILAGGIAVAVNPRAADSELPAVLGEIQPQLVITTDGRPLPGRRTSVTVRSLVKGPVTEPVQSLASDPASYIQSSGSTGKPKFIIQTHGMYTMAAEGFPFWLGLDQSDVLLTALPLSHLNAQAYSTLGSFGVGARLCLLERFSATTFWESATASGATVVNAIGAMLELLMSRQPSPAERAHHVRCCYSAPAPEPARHRAIEARFGFQLVIGYAQSESPYGLICPVDGTAVSGSMGMPRQHPRLGTINHARVADPETGEEVGVGEVGELLLHNPAMTPGYFHMPDESAALRRDGWLRTGDLVRQDDAGNFFFAGRLKEMIRRRGENLSPAEVEAVLDAHPSVTASAVIGVPSALSEEDIKAFVLVDPECSVEPDELHDWCAARLPPYKRPRFVEFVQAWPLTDTNKIAKRELPRERTAAEVDLQAVSDSARSASVGRE